jgi:hypothetical protein
MEAEVGKGAVSSCFIYSLRAATAWLLQLCSCDSPATRSAIDGLHALCRHAREDCLMEGVQRHSSMSASLSELESQIGRTMIRRGDDPLHHLFLLKPLTDILNDLVTTNLTEDEIVLLPGEKKPSPGLKSIELAYESTAPGNPNLCCPD